MPPGARGVGEGGQPEVRGREGEFGREDKGAEAIGRDLSTPGAEGIGREGATGGLPKGVQEAAATYDAFVEGGKVVDVPTEPASRGLSHYRVADSVPLRRGTQIYADVHNLGVSYFEVRDGYQAVYRVFRSVGEFFGLKLGREIRLDPTVVMDAAARRASASRGVGDKAQAIELKPSLTSRSLKADGNHTETATIGNPFEHLNRRGDRVVVSQRIGTGEIVFGEARGTVPLYAIEHSGTGFVIEPLEGAHSYKDGLRMADDASDGAFVKAPSLGLELDPGVAEIKIGDHEMVLVVPNI
ncbi:MAG TPA: hypothetical protein VLJ37_00780 [bacterium]|nr:hypothetical protein [bacterium]